MIDISMCADSKCPSRIACYRYRAKPSKYQSYTDFARNGKNRCESWLFIIDSDDIRAMEEIEPKQTEE